MRHVVLIDGGFVKVKFRQALKRRATAADICDLANSVSKKHAEDHRLLRIYYYDSPPLRDNVERPISGEKFSLKDTDVYRYNKKLLSELKSADYVAVREGTLVHRGWRLTNKAMKSIAEANGTSVPVTDEFFKPDIQQKGVDTKIGLDVAWISFCQTAERILLVSGDSDFVPAMKAARRNGVQIILCTLNHGVYQAMYHSADIVDRSSIKSLLELNS